KVADGTRNMVGGTHEKFMAIMQRAFDYLHLDLSLLNMLFLIVLIFVLKAVFVYGAKRYQVITMQEIVRNIRTKLSRGLRDLSYKEFVQTDVGQLQNTLTGESYKMKMACTQYLEVIKGLLVMLVYVGFAFVLDWEFSILIVAAGLITNFIYRYFYKRTKNLSREITKNNHQYDGIVIEAVNRFKYLKASGRNRDFTDRLIKVLNELIDNNIKVGTLGAKMGSMVEPMVVIVFSVVIGVYLLVFHAAL